MMTIRRAVPGDAHVLTEFNIALAWESERLTLDRTVITGGVKLAFSSPELCTYFVAEREGEPVGQLMITPELSDWRNGLIWWIQSVYVAKTARRQGVFKALYAHVKSEAQRHQNVRCIRLYVEKDNAEALHTYGAVGLTKTDYLVMESPV